MSRNRVHPGLGRAAGSAKRCRAIAIAGIVGFGALTEPARADFTLCNTTPGRIGVAIGYQDKVKKGWATEGWWTLAPKTCETLLKGKKPGRFLYIHAVDYDRGGGWSGPSAMCIKDQAFIVRGTENCEKRGARQTGFFEIDTGNAKHWTVRLADPAKDQQGSK